MDIESTNKQIQAENDNYNRHLNRLQQEILDLKKRHQRRISDLQSQKQQATSQIKQENFNPKSKAKLILEQLTKFD